MIGQTCCVTRCLLVISPEREPNGLWMARINTHLRDGGGRQVVVRGVVQTRGRARRQAPGAAVVLAVPEQQQQALLVVTTHAKRSTQNHTHM